MHQAAKGAFRPRQPHAPYVFARYFFSPSDLPRSSSTSLRSCWISFRISASLSSSPRGSTRYWNVRVVRGASAVGGAGTGVPGVGGTTRLEGDAAVAGGTTFGPPT